MVNVNEQVRYFLGLIRRTATRSESWKMFGFKSMPIRSKFFRKFADKSRLGKKKFLWKELILLPTIDIIQTIKEQDISETDKTLYIIGVLSELFLPLSKDEIFNSDESYLEFIKKGCEDYLDKKGTPKEKYIKSFISRAEKSVDEKNVKSLIAGAAVVAATCNQEKGLILDRDVLASKILPLYDLVPLNTHLNSDKSRLKLYHDFASEFINKK